MKDENKGRNTLGEEHLLEYQAGKQGEYLTRRIIQRSQFKKESSKGKAQRKHHGEILYE